LQIFLIIYLPVLHVYEMTVKLAQKNSTGKSTTWVGPLYFSAKFSVYLHLRFNPKTESTVVTPSDAKRGVG